MVSPMQNQASSLVAPLRRHKRQSLIGLAFIAGSFLLASRLAHLKPNTPEKANHETVAWDGKLSPGAQRALQAAVSAVTVADVTASEAAQAAGDLCQRFAGACLLVKEKSHKVSRRTAQELQDAAQRITSSRVAQDLTSISSKASIATAESVKAMNNRALRGYVSAARAVEGAVRRSADAADEVVARAEH
eukprot:CAMPEP_0197640550 /NCGR_PEP_ID=MMETSP1338-20131121/14806_1 /TAXON_ID=43686 ORGANISM="Pelagodinium beii, Strain RCC1491" /NCGR_SAMPLE_ID=MMETSP1338 /ASSEMBLY_ACC=CAM_ASM_000754 /LENGTH=189 /DNA_ID=CAMNT_0043213413 /DNA_START=183 /DNA_END=752 /DNA_ORIENTATION=-